MKKLLLLLIIGTYFNQQGQAQTTRYIIELRNKANTPFSLNNPSEFLSARALERRARYHISIDSTDLPVTPSYLDSIRSSGNVTILNTSRWLNQVAILTTDSNALIKINNFPFVKNSSKIANRDIIFIKKFPEAIDIPLQADLGKSDGLYSYGLSNDQVNIHRGDFLHNHRFRGEGMQLALLDAGFLRYKTLPTFDSIRLTNRVLGSWDFVSRDSNVNDDNSHGMQCLSTIAANLPGTFVGSAPNTSFYLFRTEDVASEYPIEEQNWAAGIEKADSLGVDIISSSLGYNNFSDPMYNYTYADMDGKTTISARAANISARKGMLVFISAGNEGNNSWHYITTPADADSIITVAAVDTFGNIAGFSSYGPSSDGRQKPSMASVGASATVASANSGLPIYSTGTSFACPNLAGIATCLWQAYPELNNMDIKDMLEKASNKANNPDVRFGFGIPDAKKAFILCQKKLFSLHSPAEGNCNVNISFNVKSDSSMSVIIERKLETENQFLEMFSATGSTIFSNNNYSYTDSLPHQLPGIIKYRIRLDINADTSYYLDSVILNFQQQCAVTANSFTLIQPFAGSEETAIKLATTADGNGMIILHDILGRKVYRSAFKQSEGIQTRKIPMNNLSPGVYIVSVYFDEKRVLTGKVINP